MFENHSKKTLATALEVLRRVGQPHLTGSPAPYQEGAAFRQEMQATKAELVDRLTTKARRHGADKIANLLGDIAAVERHRRIAQRKGF